MHAADYILIPTPLEMMSVNGLRQLLERIDEVRDESNPHCRSRGCGHDGTADQRNRPWTRRCATLVANEVSGHSTRLSRRGTFSNASNQREVVAALDSRSPIPRHYREYLPNC